MATSKLQTILKQARQVKGVSLREVEKATEISNAYLSQLEGGTAKEPSPRILHKLAGYYGISYSSLMAAAGYLHGDAANGTSSSEVMFMGDQLSPAEAAAVASFIHTLRERSGKK